MSGDERKNGEIEIIKAKGRLQVLREMTDNGRTVRGQCGIGQTRWATHGEPSIVNAHPHFSKDRTIAVVHNGIIENYKELKEHLQKKGYTFVSETDTEVVVHLLIVNAHPHFSKDRKIAVVHNGIIENYKELKEHLQKKGYTFVSETDTEVVVHLLDYYYKGDPLEAISKVLGRVRGSYALGILFQDVPETLYAVRKDSPLIIGKSEQGEAISKVLGRVRGSYALGILFQDVPETLYAVRKDSPLIIGKSEQGNFIASDVPAILKYTKTVCYIEDREIAEITADHIAFYDIDQEELEREFKTVEWDAKAAEKEGFEHFMLKEIYEQPKAVADTISPRIQEGKIVIEELEMSDEEIQNISREEIQNISRIQIVACGSAYHVGMCAKYVLEQMAKIPVDVDLASEFRYRNPLMTENTLVIVISQSGETADSLAALREAQKRGFKVLGIVNVVGSSIAREADSVLYTWAGPEISVATTKAYSTRQRALYLGRTGDICSNYKGIQHPAGSNLSHWAAVWTGSWCSGTGGVSGVCRRTGKAS